MPLVPLISKSFLYWRRHYVSSFLQLLIPVLSIAVLFSLRASSTEVVFEEGTGEVPLFSDMGVLAGVSPTLLRATMKKCGGRYGGSIALIPDNWATRRLESYFSKMGFASRFFGSDDELQQYVWAEDYSERLVSGGKDPLICLGVSFGSEGLGASNFEYSLRFNQSNVFRKDYPEDYEVEFRSDAPEYFASAVVGGTLQLKAVIDSILISQAGNMTTRVFARKMPSAPSRYSELTALQTPTIVALLCAALLPMMRLVSMVSSERESGAQALLAGMGAPPRSQALVAAGGVAFEQLIIGLIVSLFLKIVLFRHTSFAALLLGHWLFVAAMVAMGFLIASVVDCSRPALVIAAGLAAGLLVAQVAAATTGGGGPPALIVIDPVAAMGYLVWVIVGHESARREFGLGRAGVEFGKLRPVDAWLALGLQAVVFFVVGIGLGAFKSSEVGAGWRLPRLRCRKSRKVRNVGEEKNPQFTETVEAEGPERQVFLATTGGTDKNPTITISLGAENGPQQAAAVEAPEAALEAQREAGRSLRVENLSKVFPDGKVALSGVNLELFSGQIFVLLGRNGAGKSTLVSIIGRASEQTGGALHLPKGAAIGRCPQYDPLLPYLSVRETLSLAAGLRGILQEGREIERLLSDLGLEAKADCLCSTLSGGQKRKVCVALALLGDPEVVLLDEPSAGMDPLARREFWDVLKKIKRDKVVLITTHDMEEADYLADRVGFIAGGRVAAVGSPLFLKQRFGMGMELTVVFEPGAPPVSIDRLRRFVEARVESARPVKAPLGQAKFRLPLDAAKEFPGLLRDLEESKELWVRGLSVSQTTLAQVFVNLIEFTGQAAQAGENLNSDGPLIGKAPAKTLEPMKGAESTPSGPIRVYLNPGVGRVAQQIYGLLVKRALGVYRDWFSLFMEVVFPAMLIIGSFFAIRITFVGNTSLVAISPSACPGTSAFAVSLDQSATNILSPSSLAVFDNSSPGLGSPPQNLTSSELINLFDPGLSPLEFPSSTPSSFSASLNTSSLSGLAFGLHLSILTPESSSVTFFMNSTSPFSGLLALDFASNLLLRLSSNNPSASIRSRLLPLPATRKVASLESSGDGLLVTLFLCTAFTLLATSVVAALARERESGAKHQQMLSGTRGWVYWSANFLFDYAKYLCLAMLSFGLFFLFELKYFTSDPAGVMTFLLLAWYGFPFLMLVYLLSLLGPHAFASQISTFLACFLGSVFLPALVNALRVPASTRNLAHKVLQNIGRILPFFAFPNGFINISNLPFYTVAFDLGYTPNAIDPFYGALFDFFFLFFTAFFAFLALVLLEAAVHVRATCSCDRSGKVLPVSGASERDAGDALVARERKQALEGGGFAARLSRVFKVFGGGWLGAGPSVQALSDLSLALRPGEVLALLGANGAGKSTIFRLLTAETVATRGAVELRGLAMPGGLAELRSQLGHCGQAESLFDHLSVKEHLRLYCRLKGLRPSVHSHMIESLLEEFGLGSFGGVPAGKLSGGNKRKLSVAIAFLGRPPLVLLDEPMAGMDPEAKRCVAQAIERLRESDGRSSVVITTHEMEEAEGVATKVAFMVGGRMKTVGSAREIRDTYGNGYEIEIKLELPDPSYYDHCSQILQGPLNASTPLELSKSQIPVVLTLLRKEELSSQISIAGSGASIHSLLERGLTVPFKPFIEWADLASKIEILRAKMSSKFGASLVEIRHSFLMFRTPPGQILSNLLEALEGFKQDMVVNEYVFREISMEQILVNFVRADRAPAARAAPPAL